MRIELKDSIRWLDLGHKMVLQVRQLVFKPEGGEGQGTYDEVWVDVPVVIPGQSKQQGAPQTNAYSDLESKDKSHLVENIAAWVTRWSLSKDRDIGELRAFLRDRLGVERSKV